MPDGLRDAFSQLSTLGKGKVLARMIHAETIHARDAYTADYEAPDGVRLRERNETVHRLSGVMMAVLGERMTATHHDYMVELIELIVARSQRRREQLMRWIAEAASQA